MSIKTFCDVCGDELNEDAARGPTTVQRTFGSPIRRTVTVSVTFIPGQSDIENLCQNCLYRVLDAGDPRPREMSA